VSALMPCGWLCWAGFAGEGARTRTSTLRTGFLYAPLACASSRPAPPSQPPRLRPLSAPSPAPPRLCWLCRRGGAYKNLNTLLRHKLVHHDSSKCEPYFRKGVAALSAAARGKAAPSLRPQTRHTSPPKPLLLTTFPAILAP